MSTPQCKFMPPEQAAKIQFYSEPGFCPIGGYCLSIFMPSTVRNTFTLKVKTHTIKPIEGISKGSLAEERTFERYVIPVDVKGYKRNIPIWRRLT